MGYGDYIGTTIGIHSLLRNQTAFWDGRPVAGGFMKDPASRFREQVFIEIVKGLGANKF